MRMIGVKPWDEGSIVELTRQEQSALRTLYEAVRNDKYPPGQDCHDLVDPIVFSLIENLGIAISQQNLSDESIKKIVRSMTEASER